VVGNEERVLERSRQLMPNPFERHDIRITNRHYWDLVKRYAKAFDGAFVVGGDGRILAAMRYLVAEEEVRMPQGLGTRHRAVAGITSLTGAVGVTVSGEDGMVRVFEKGEVMAVIHPLDGTLEILKQEV
jgi:DNA integrity scanning protein DisA with diadenylate cyclase activity